LPKASFPSEAAEVASNPTLTFEGMSRVHGIVPVLRMLGRFDALFSSRMARALDTASVLALAFNLEIRTISGLGQHANMEGGKVVRYPGYEDEGISTWQRQGISAIEQIFHLSRDAETVLAVSHRPVIAGIVCSLQGIRDPQKIKQIAEDQSFFDSGFVVLDATEPRDGGILFNCSTGFINTKEEDNNEKASCSLKWVSVSR
jgi:broad specificity phosphatase PhoE